MNGLAPLLTEWLPNQRWFGARGRPITAVDITSATPLITEGELRLDHLLVEVSFSDGTATYQLYLGTREQARPELDHAVIGQFDGRVAYDGLHDTEVTAWLLEAVRAGRTVGALRFVPEPDAKLAEPGTPGRVLTAEQSNTSVSWGEQSILKVFRRVQPGINPDLELHRALHASNEVAKLQGAVESDTTTLGMLQDYQANSSDGWQLALGSVRDLLAEADLRADEVGGDFAGESERLGGTIGVLHTELAEALGRSTRDPRELAADWNARLATAVESVAELGEYAERIAAVYGQVATGPAPVPAQRVHGDLHLGQALRTPYGWFVIDFEGEPSAAHADRVRPDSPLRDVAGMLRSFDYAAYHQVSQDLETEAEQQALWHANEWAQRNRAAFCAGYATMAGIDPREHLTLLQAYELDKAVYETVYETRNRPSWAQIPLASINRLTAET